MIVLPNYTTHRYFFDWIKPNSRVLDIGCGIGAVGKKLNNEKNCHMIGIDTIDVSELEGYNHYMSLDIQNVEFNYNKFDYIILGDVLEHLDHPFDVLLKVRKWLNPEGKILISVPNVANWKIRLSLLFGNFDYTNSGIMDTTHKRFYTRKTITKLIESAGLDIKEMKVTSDLMPARFWYYLGKVFPAFAYQFVIIAEVR